MNHSQSNDVPRLPQYLLELTNLCIIVFVGLAIAVHFAPLGLGWDNTILWALHTIHQPTIDYWAKTLTALGIWSFTVPFWGLTGVILAYQKQWRKVTYIILTVLGSMLLSTSLKLLFHRPRPHLWQSDLPWPTNPSFPSGHAFSSMMLVMLLILFWPWKGRIWIALAGAFFVLLIGWTRLYLGVHYPSDILAGWSAAIAWCLGVYIVYPPEPSITKPEE